MLVFGREQQCCAAGAHHHDGQGRLQLLFGRQPPAITLSPRGAWMRAQSTVVLGDTEAAEESPLGRRKARKGGLREDERGRRGSCAPHSCCWRKILDVCTPTVWLRRSYLSIGLKHRVQGLLGNEDNFKSQIKFTQRESVMRKS